MLDQRLAPLLSAGFWVFAVVLVFETGSHCVALTDLELKSFLCLWKAGIKSVSVSLSLKWGGGGPPMDDKPTLN